MPELEPSLHQLADAYGIATDYWDWQGRHVEVARETIVAVLAALDVDASTPEAAASALEDKHRLRWSQMLPPCLALREHRTASVEVHVPHGDPAETWIELETGGSRGPLRQLENWLPPQEIGGGLVGEASFEIPGDLPLGYHTLHARSYDRHATMPLIITPVWLGFPERMGERRAWGLAAQLYSVRSRQSWGVGDVSDLEDLAVWSAGEHGADFVLVNPLHAAEPVAPMEPSPYLPTSRRFANPIYLRVERIVEYALLSEEQRAKVDKHRVKLKVRLASSHPIDRNRSWTAKRKALKIHLRGAADTRAGSLVRGVSAPRGPRPGRLRHLVRAGRDIRAGLRGVAGGAPGPGVASGGRFAAEHADRIDFHCWLQWLLDEQLASAHQAGLRAGMALGVMHDLAVGVSRHGADAWGLQSTYAAGITVGAPPDPYNQNGQDWNQPPWRPDRLAATAYAPFRQMVSTILRHAGGIRVDHVIGLFRLWWIPAGAGPDAGHLRPLRPRGHGRHPGPRGPPRRGAGGGGGPGHRRAVGAALPPRTRHPRHVDPVVRVRLGRRRCPARAGEVAGVLPGFGDHP